MPEERAENLNLYLTYIEENLLTPEQWQALEDRFSGMPGYERMEETADA